ncbi:hypothetical protein [Pseudomonas kuykendallii]|uniref:Uncharacterized protein n=1 Tax=Pseudomonas kuykendallii TaxID=1007099 RepID=A0A2W5CMP8_9PSED|nr:hypothetical protein [Pseudomonas kuykendallii]PZP20895.1 MAG: hypothetical protein DI599_21155 [Pseudomonas kuykendallii]
MPKTENTLLPPYPRLGECYRILAKALDTKASNRHVDQLARKGDFDWQLLESLRDELIRVPLGSKSNVQFARFVASAMETLQENYVQLIKTVALDSLTREQALPVLAEHFLAPYLGSFLLQMHKAIPSPPLAQLLDEQRHPVDITLTWLENELEIAPNHLGQQLYPDACGENKNGREAIRRWRQGEQLPELQSIALLHQKLQTQFPARPLLLQAFTEWLIVARALAVLESTASGFIRLRQCVFQQVLSDIPIIDIGVILSLLNIEAAAHKRGLVESGLLLFEQLKRTTEKSRGDQARTRYALDQFRVHLGHHDPKGISTYYLEWLEGRWHVLAGQLDTALLHFELAADLALYRSGQTQKDILREALLLAAYLGKRPLYKRLKHRALVMGLSYLPGGKESVASDHELKLIRDNFTVKFPERGRFVDPVPELSALH